MVDLKLPTEFDISNEMPEELQSKSDIQDFIAMFFRMLDEQQAGIDLMRRYLKIIERKLNV